VTVFNKQSIDLIVNILDKETDRLVQDMVNEKKSEMKKILNII
jgi:hypothetical protein